MHLFQLLTDLKAITDTSVFGHKLKTLGFHFRQHTLSTHIVLGHRSFVGGNMDSIVSVLMNKYGTVSYTHLTLPTNREV